MAVEMMALNEPTANSEINEILNSDFLPDYATARLSAINAFASPQLWGQGYNFGFAICDLSLPDRLAVFVGMQMAGGSSRGAIFDRSADW